MYIFTDTLWQKQIYVRYTTKYYPTWTCDCKRSTYIFQQAVSQSICSWEKIWSRNPNWRIVLHYNLKHEHRPPVKELFGTQIFAAFSPEFQPSNKMYKARLYKKVFWKAFAFSFRKIGLKIKSKGVFLPAHLTCLCWCFDGSHVGTQWVYYRE